MEIHDSSAVSQLTPQLDKDAHANSRAESRELTEEEQKKVDELKKTDQEVRQHEQAHLVAAGSLARGGAKYEYETGPDGKRYAVSGSVDIDSSKVPGDPEATIDKARKVRRAALAPAEPSATDRRVAAKASQMEQAAQQELREQKQAEKEVYDRAGNSGYVNIKLNDVDITA